MLTLIAFPRISKIMGNSISAKLFALKGAGNGADARAPH